MKKSSQQKKTENPKARSGIVSANLSPVIYSRHNRILFASIVISALTLGYVTDLSLVYVMAISVCGSFICLPLIWQAIEKRGAGAKNTDHSQK